MFRLANNLLQENEDTYGYMSSIASEVIYNALETWNGSVEDTVYLYTRHFVFRDGKGRILRFFDIISQFVPSDIVREEIHGISQ